MSDDKIPLSTEQALSMLGNGENIHTFRTPFPGMMIGCDWSRESLVSAIEENECELGGPMCQKMNHGLIVHADGPLFVECSNGFDYEAFEADVAHVAPQEQREQLL